MRSQLPFPATACVAAAAALLGCGAQQPRACATSADCPSDAYCIEGACRADSPPTALIAPPAALLSHTRLAFDGSGSRDPDPDDGIAGYEWSLRVVSASCNGTPQGGTGAVFQPVITCPGEFEVRLVATDRYGVASVPAALRFAVTLVPEPPTVTAAADLAVDHRCAGAPLACAAVDAGGSRALQLGAAGSSPVGDAFSFRWSGERPAGASAARVTYTPGPDVQTPTVSIDTDGTAIAGEWSFVVEATDARGLVAVGAQRIAVGNAAPVIASVTDPVSVPHLFDAGGSRFLAHGTIPAASVFDPDGDPIVLESWQTSTTDAGPGTFTLGSDHRTFDVAVPYARPSDGAFLVGPTVSRSIRYTVADVNGAASSATWPIVVTNRAPRIAAAVGAVAVPHAFDAAASQYVATATLSTFVDDDGDPLLVDADTGFAPCTARSSGAAAVASCAVPYAGTPRVGDLAGLRRLSVTVRDPLEGAVTAPADVTIEDQPPTVTSASYALPASCGKSVCCDPDPSGCLAWGRSIGAASGTGVTPATDPDGDPIVVTYVGTGGSISPNPETCIPGSCPPIQLAIDAEPDACNASGTATLSVVASDGAAQGTGTITLTHPCR